MEITRSDHPGVLSWCNSIRLTIAQDPGRQFIDEQIQKLGFDFLDDYLDNVFKGPQFESVTDLLKTPGRKRHALMKARNAAATPVSLEKDEKENNGPINDFQKALFKAKLEKEAGKAGRDIDGTRSRSPFYEFSTPPHTQDSTKPPVVASQRQQSSAASSRIVSAVPDASPPPEHPNDAIDMDIDEPIITPFTTTVKSNQMLSVPLQTEHPGGNQPTPKELSMIAEADESHERSRISISPFQQVTTSTNLSTAATRVPEVETVATPTDVQHSTSARYEQRDSHPSLHVDTPNSALHIPSHSLSEYGTPLATINFEETSRSETTSQSAPLPDQDSSSRESHGTKDDPAPAGRDEASVAGSAHMRKPSVSQFSNLPAPSPLRKSMRFTRDPPAETHASLPLPANPPAVGGKRSSWLVKAREAKALEAVGRKTGTFEAPLLAAGHQNSKKRKSSEMTREEAHVTGQLQALKPRASIERSSKQQRLTDGEEEPASHRAKDKDADTLELPVRHIHTTERNVVSTQPQQLQQPEERPDHQFAEDFTVAFPSLDSEDGMLANLKRTVQGFGARAGKSMGKSLGGNAAAALAEARAAAEARVAERNRAERGSLAEGQGNDSVTDSAVTQQSPSETTALKSAEPANHARPSNDVPAIKTHHPRLSVSDLVPTFEGKMNSESPPVPQVTSTKRSSPDVGAANTSASTTPPNSPPATQPGSFKVPTEPVFKKPPVVFVAPSATSSAKGDRQPAPPKNKEYAFKLPTTNPFSIPAAMALGVPASFPSSSSQHSSQGKANVLSAQSSKASLFSDTVFDKDDIVPAWMPTTQDTDYSTQLSQNKGQDTDFEDDDSWHVDEKFASNQMWTPFGFASADKDDSMTWSTLPSRSTSQKGGDTDVVPPSQNFGLVAPIIKRPPSVNSMVDDVHDALGTKVDSDIDETDLVDAPAPMDGVETESELDDILEAGKSTVGLVQRKAEAVPARSESQMSTASTTSSQSQLGFFGQASKLVTSVLGGGKKVKPEPVKSLALAAVAAKKQQEETEKKAARLREMESRRQQVSQKKAEEEKTRAVEEERKFKEEAERRKREREEHTDKRPLKAPMKKPEEDTTKKRQVTAEVERKVEMKKPPSKDQSNAPPRVAKPATGVTPVTKTGSVMKPALKQPTASNSHSTPAASSSSIKPPNPSETKTTKTIKHVASQGNLSKSTSKSKLKVQAREDDVDQPSQVVQSQMANRAKAQIQASQPVVTSESIELPDINSEYSDSEDESRPRSFNPPGWAQSPELREALQQQSTMNPDDIFGRIGPLRMEEIFRTRQSRFRARTSSANWAGVDQLTEEEERAYARRMGFQ